MKKTLTMREFQLILADTSPEDKIGHLFTVDIEVDFERSAAKELLFNEIYTPIFEKKKVLPPSERSVFQLLDAMRLNDQRLLRSYKTTAKTHSTMDKKIFITLYAEHINFLIRRCGWLVTRIYSDFSRPIKKEFVIMNQVSRQNAKTNIEKDFYKLMNNSNFDYDCRNNVDNCFFAPIIDEIEEGRYLRKY